jgi:hypothetical protein
MENNQSLPVFVWVVTAHYTHSEPISAAYVNEESALITYKKWKTDSENAFIVTIQKCFLFTL